MRAAALALWALAVGACAGAPDPSWQAEIGQTKVRVYQIQTEDPKPGSAYDWGACVMKDGDLYRMWWTRPNAPTDKTAHYESTDDEGNLFTYDYKLHGDHVFYAESRDGYTWRLNGNGEEVPVDQYGPDSPHPVIVLGTAESKWEKQQLGDPSVVKVGGKFYMYYEAASDFKPRKNETPIEYNCSVFLATSEDGRRWTKWPNNRNPQPIVRAPDENKLPGRKRYGCGQPSVCYKDGRFILHYVDSVAWPDVMVRLESPDPLFRKDVKRISGLRNPTGFAQPIPEGTVSKFAMTDICLLGDSFYLVRPVYGTDRVAILRSDSGVFWCDEKSNDPLWAASRQVAVHDPRGVEFRARLYPRFLRGPHGEIIGDERHMSVFYGAGQYGPGWTAYTWDIHRADFEFDKPLASERDPLQRAPN